MSRIKDYIMEKQEDYMMDELYKDMQKEGDLEKTPSEEKINDMYLEYQKNATIKL